MLRRLYDWVIALAAHRHALPALAAISFIESSIFPIPPDVLLVPMVLADRTRAMRIAFVCTIASVLGGIVGYGIGYYLYEAVGRQIVEFYGYGAQFEEFRGIYAEWGMWIVVGAAVTPFPYKVITIASGVFALDIVTFALASVVGRGFRFYLEAGLFWYAGPPIRAFVERYLPWVTTAFFVLLLGGFAIARYAV